MFCGLFMNILKGWYNSNSVPVKHRFVGVKAVGPFNLLITYYEKCVPKFF